MSIGRLGAAALGAANSYVTAYTVPVGMTALCSVSICNRTTGTVKTRVAVSVGTTPTAAEFIEYDVSLATGQTLKRTGITMNGGDKLVFTGNVANSLSCVVTGSEIPPIPVGAGYILPIASPTALGGFKVGGGLSIDSQTGVLSTTSTAYQLPIAQDDTLGGVKISTGSGLAISVDGQLSLESQTPLATSAIPGLVRVGDGLQMIDGVGGAGLDTLTLKLGAGLSLDTNHALQVTNPSQSLVVSGGTTSVNPTTTIAFPSGCVTNSGNGTATITFPASVLPVASTAALGIMKVGTGLEIRSGNAGLVDLSKATASALGGIKVGSGLSVAADGTLSATSGGVPLTVKTVAGSPTVNNVATIVFPNGTLAQSGTQVTYTPSDATTTSKGVVQVGSNLSVSGGNLSLVASPTVTSLTAQDGTITIRTTTAPTLKFRTTDAGSRSIWWQAYNGVMQLIRTTGADSDTPQTINQGTGSSRWPFVVDSNNGDTNIGGTLRVFYDIHARNLYSSYIENSGDIYMAGNLKIQSGSPTIYLMDTDNADPANGRSAMIHVNSNQFYVLKSASSADDTTWTAFDNGRWPLKIDLNNGYLTVANSIDADGNLGCTGAVLAQNFLYGKNYAHVDSNGKANHSILYLDSDGWYEYPAGSGSYHPYESVIYFRQQTTTTWSIRRNVNNDFSISRFNASNAWVDDPLVASVANGALYSRGYNVLTNGGSAWNNSFPIGSIVFGQCADLYRVGDNVTGAWIVWGSSAGMWYQPGGTWNVMGCANQYEQVSGYTYRLVAVRVA